MEQKIKTHIKEFGSKLSTISKGWGTGYVLIPEGHPLHGKHYDEIDLDVHGGLTYSDIITTESAKAFGLSDNELGMWMIGFDTAHYDDNEENCPMEYVQIEANRLMQQVIEFNPEQHAR